MPISAKGQEIMAKMSKRYGAKKGKSVFYATANARGKSSTFYQLAHGTKK